MIVAGRVADGRKKVGQYSYSGKDVIGKGYSSVVYKAQNESNGTFCPIQDK